MHTILKFSLLLPLFLDFALADTLVNNKPSTELPPPEMLEKYYNRSSAELEKLAEQGDGEAAADLAFRYGIGDRVEKDPKLAEKWYRRSVELESLRGMDGLADHLMRHQKELEAVKLLEQAVEKGSAISMVSLGFAYYNGTGVKADKAKALEYYKKAAKLGEPKAHSNLGYFYLEGIQVEQNFDKALFHLRTAIKGKNPAAMTILGQMYLDGKGVEKDPEKAFSYFKESSRYGFIGGLMGQAMCYLEGTGVEKNVPKAIKLFEKAVEFGSASAANFLGQIYYADRFQVQDFKKAKSWYTKAFKLGDVDALVHLAWMQKRGDGMKEPNPKLALELLKMASDLGHPRAKWILQKEQETHANEEKAQLAPK